MKRVANLVAKFGVFRIKNIVYIVQSLGHFFFLLLFLFFYMRDAFVIHFTPSMYLFFFRTSHYSLFHLVILVIC